MATNPQRDFTKTVSTPQARQLLLPCFSLLSALSGCSGLAYAFSVSTPSILSFNSKHTLAVCLVWLYLTLKRNLNKPDSRELTPNTKWANNLPNA